MYISHHTITPPRNAKTRYGYLCAGGGVQPNFSAEFQQMAAARAAW
jgi:hypothetical protein